MDLSDVSIETDQIREWRSIVTLIVFFLASEYMQSPACLCTCSVTPLGYRD